MAIHVYSYASVTCDKCGTGYDEMGYNAKELMNYLKRYGWTGTYRKCYCPDCSKEEEVLADDEG